MVAPLALPLVGLLAAGAGMALKPHYENYAAKTRGKYREGLLADVDHSDPDALGLSLFKGGLLDTKDFQADVRTAFEGVQDRANALQRQKIASGPAYARLAWDKSVVKAADDATIAAMEADGIDPILRNIPAVREAYNEAVGNKIIQEYGPQFDLSNDPEYLRRRQLLEDEAALERSTVPEIVQQDAQTRGDAWIGMTPEERADIITLENSVDVVDNVLDYVERTTAAGRAATAATSGEAAQLQREFELATLPYLQRLFQAGAMQAAEFELFDRLRGDPFAWNQFSEKEQASVMAVLNRMRTDLSATNRSFGLNDVHTSNRTTPPGLQPGLPNGGSTDPQFGQPTTLVPRAD